MKKNWKKILVALLFADFAALTGYVVYQYGYIGFWKIALSNMVTIQILVDLTIALLFVTGLMIKDARERGVNVMPYLLLTLGLGSLGPMLYYLLRKAPQATQDTTHAAGHGAAKAVAA